MRTAFLLLLVFVPQEGSKKDRFAEELFDQFKWREIGPGNMGGRITDIAVLESKPQHFLVGAASGGVWKTVNNGTTWTSIFDSYGTSSIGDLDICQSNPDLIWVGTGESNARNSVTPGDGVYKSKDGGRTFENMGLKGTRHIGRVVIHPKNPDTVFVAALGCIYQPSRDRGLFRTTDAGKTWTCVNFIDEETGFIDLALDPAEPNTMLAAAYAVRRDGFSSSASPTLHKEGAGIYRSTDGGDTWTKMTQGLPKGPMGRIGLDYHRKNSKIVYAIVETKATTAMDTTPGTGTYMGINAEDGDGGVTLTQVAKDGPAEKAGLAVGDVIKEFGGKPVDNYQALVVEIRSRKAGDKVTVKFLRGSEEKTTEVTLTSREEREEGGTKLISLQDPGDKGGVFRSDDGGENWKFMSTQNPRPFYFSQIRVDPADDLRIYVLGVNLASSDDGGKKWKGDVARAVHSDHHAMWIDPRDPDHIIDGTDGGVYVSWDRSKTWEHLNNMGLGQFYAVGLDNAKPYHVCGGLQDNGTWYGTSRSRNSSISNDEFQTIQGGDGFYVRIDPTDPNTVYCESQYGMIVRIDLKTKQAKGIRPRDVPGDRNRWEWNTPIELSPIDPKTVYVGAHRLFESRDRGDTMTAISADLCRTKLGSITTIGPSAVDANVVWAGTNDGAVQVTRDRGKTWTDVAANVTGLPPLLWVTRVEPSRRDAGTCYLTVEGRRKDDLRTYAWRTSDYGATWTSLAGSLPAAEPAYVIREHPKNPSVLFLGTERTVYVSIDGGSRWVRLQRNLPVAPVHDLQIQARDGELVAATHGRGLWAIDIKPFEELTRAVVDGAPQLFEPATVVRWTPGKQGWFGGSKGFKGGNPPPGATIWYYVRDEAKNVTLSIVDAKGKPVTKLAASSRAGLHRTSWNLLRGNARSGAGEYMVVLSVEGASSVRILKVEDDPDR